MKILLVILGILAILIGAPMLQGAMAPRMLMWSPSMKQIYAPKSGRIIDLSTGKGVAEAMVVETSYYTAESTFSFLSLLFSNWGHSGSGGYCHCVLYTLGTQTDTDGNYSFPETREISWDAIKDVSTALVSRSLNVDWKIDVLKPGFAVKGAPIARAFDKYDFPLHPQFQAKGSAFISYNPPEFKQSGDKIEIEPISVIALSTLGLSPKEEVVFYRESYIGASPDHRYILGKQILHPGSRIGGPLEKDDLRWKMFDRLKELACSATPDAEMGSSEVAAYAYFAPDWQAFFGRLQELEPEAFNKQGSTIVPKSGYEHAIYHAGNVCKSFSERP